MQKLSMEALNRISVAEFKDKQKLPITVVLDNVRSMNNVGSVFRTADGFLIEQIVLCGFTPQPPHRDIQKTALGATETVNWKHAENTVDIIHELKTAGYKVYAIEQVTSSIMLNHFKIQEHEKIAVVFGNEVDGVSDEALALCDGAIEIPQLGTKHSLNISVAAGIVLWKLFEQHIK
jgi:23S rRNA (guanosine2251-2'-O)-methyltransferase